MSGSVTSASPVVDQSDRGVRLIRAVQRTGKAFCRSVECQLLFEGDDEQEVLVLSCTNDRLFGLQFTSAEDLRSLPKDAPMRVTLLPSLMPAQDDGDGNRIQSSKARSEHRINELQTSVSLTLYLWMPPPSIL